MVDEQTRWCVAAMLAPIRPGASSSRAAWPAHVTLASSFRVADPAALHDVVESAVRDVGTLDVRLGRMAWFGDRQDVPVLLVASSGVERAHERLAQALVPLPGFAADTPRHWRAGYRPHLTLGRAVSMPGGSDVTVDCLAIARLDGQDAVVEAVLRPPVARRPSA